MKTEWSDSESSDDETGASDGSPKKTSGNEDYNGRSKSNDQLLHNDDGNEGQSEDVDDRVFELEKLNPVEDNEDEVLQTDRLFVRNLPYTATEDELEELFSKIGTVSQVHIVLDKQTKRSKGFAYIQYSSPEFASRALEELDNSIFQGRLLHVLPAKTENLPRQRRVVENIARKFGVSKSDVLDPESDDIAVRIALGETQVIAETKNALKNAGINVAALEEFAKGRSEGIKRRNRVIIVKNLPYGSSEGRTSENVVYLEPSDARAAFKGLAYKRYKDAPLYLEWAPKDVLDVTMSSNDGATDSTVIDEHDIKKHVKNGKNLSMGFGFIEFDSVDTATRTCKDLQGTVLDGHALILQLCHAKKDDKAPGKTDKDKSSTKIIVRNVAFEATEKDLRQLIKRLRLPRKFENHRGFAFIEFLTKQEAQNALQALSNTHLYGRHLVLERAKEGETLEELRKRTAAQFTNAQEGFQTNLSKKQKHTDILDEDNMEFD
ncbi:unnamed protein product [Rhodiola kirilowii]